MLIRTQDKMTLVNLDQVMEISIVGKTVRCQYANGVCRFLGTYSSEENVLELLDDIQRHYNHDAPLFIMPQEEEI
jgi:hypothetical protein